MDKVYVSWSDVEDYIEGLVKKVKKEKLKFPGIFTFPRGGLVLGVMISHALNLPLLANPCKGCLIIDDIYDEGITLKKYMDLKKEEKYFITTLFLKGKNLDYKKLDFYSKYIDKGWVVFPWEELKMKNNKK